MYLLGYKNTSKISEIERKVCRAQENITCVQMAAVNASSDTPSRSSKITIQRGKTFAIETPVPGKQVRVQVCAINDLAYIGITKFWLNEAEGKWLPTKSNVFLPTSVWKGLLQRTHVINQALVQFEKDLKESQTISWCK